MVTLTKFYEASKEHSDAAYDKAKHVLKNYLEVMQKFCLDRPYEHVYHKLDTSRIFGVASLLYPTNDQSEFNTSITTDGTYLYLAIGLPGRSQAFKIGTGDNGTIPGKVYV